MAYSRQSNGNDDDLEELLRKADQVLDDVPPEAAEEDSTPAPWEDLRFYANYNNHYGRDVRNYQNNYGRPQEPIPQEREPVRESAIPAYNVDFQEQGRARTSRSAGTQTPRRSPREGAWEEDRLDGYAPNRPAPAGKAPKKKRRKKHRVLKFFLVLLLVLLIAAALRKEQCSMLAVKAHELKLEVLLEIHSEQELEYIEDNIDMVGVNNRNLGTFHTDVENSFRLAEKLPKEMLLVSESGISSPQTVRQLRAAGFRGFLIGENFMKTPQPGNALKEFISKL